MAWSSSLYLLSIGSILASQTGSPLGREDRGAVSPALVWEPRGKAPTCLPTYLPAVGSKFTLCGQKAASQRVVSPLGLTPGLALPLGDPDQTPHTFSPLKPGTP